MKVCFVSLGCDKNRIDSEVMLHTLYDHGYEITEDEDDAEAAVVNTCCFILDAKKESIDRILEFAEKRKDGRLKALIVAGCMAQRYGKEIRKEIPEVDEIIGTTAIDQIALALDHAQMGEENDYFENIDRKLEGNQKRILSTAGYFGYLRIAEGCNKHCTYCAIPMVRGAYRSVPEEDIIEEARSLAERGVRELILVAQETTLYGTDLDGKKHLPRLLKRLCREVEDVFIRLLYCYPEEITPELIQVMKEEPKILHYLDMPIQSGSDQVLKRMGRRTSTSQIREIVQMLRKEIPDICLRTTLITGFPGETSEEHEETLAMVEELCFDRLGVFPYSREEGTPAALMKGQLTEAVKKRRRDQIMKLQQKIAFAKNQSLKGITMQAMIEGSIPEEEGENGHPVYIARTYRDAPDVDGLLFLPYVQRDHESGDMIKVLITAAKGYDLIGKEVEA